METTYKISGMTCQSCVEKVKNALSQIQGAESVVVSLEKKSVIINSPETIKLTDLKQALNSMPKYQISQTTDDLKVEKESFLQTYKPLILIFTYIFIASLSFQISLEHFNTHLFMNHIMGGFFLCLSFFKLLDIKSFSESFSSYDPLAQKFALYGLIYPFVEVALGFLFISQRFLFVANLGTVLVLSITTFGVWRSLKRKTKFQCACAGSVFKLPLSLVTVFENLAMIAMAVTSIILEI